MTRHTYEFAELDKDLFSLLRRLGYRPAIIFDIGAANGFWSHHISQIFPGTQFHLFEPLIDYVPEYRFNIERNLAQHPRFVLHKSAVGEDTGEVVISIFPNAFASTVLVPDKAVRDVSRVRVPIIRLDDAVRTYSLAVPQVVKIDVQGAELSVLRGARSMLPGIDVLLIECWLWRGYGEGTPLLLELMNWLADVGFYLWDIGDSYRGSEGILASLDCMFVNSRTMGSVVRGRVGVARSKAAERPGRVVASLGSTNADLDCDSRVVSAGTVIAGQEGGAATDGGTAPLGQGAPWVGVRSPVEGAVGVPSEDYRTQFASECAGYCTNVGGARILVVGCGNGLDCKHFVDRGAHAVHGIDVRQDVGQEWGHPAVKYVCASAEAMPFEDCSYDVVYSIASMVRVHDVSLAFAEMVRVTKAKGLIYCVAAPLWNSREGHQQSGLFPDYPWIHLRLSKEDVLAFCRSRFRVERDHDVSETVEFMFSEYFNRLPASQYLEICANLPVGHVMDNTLWLEPEEQRFGEILSDLQAHGYTKGELLAVAHKFVARK